MHILTLYKLLHLSKYVKQMRHALTYYAQYFIINCIIINLNKLDYVTS